MKRYAALLIIVIGILLMVGVFQIILKPGSRTAHLPSAGTRAVK